MISAASVRRGLVALVPFLLAALVLAASASAQPDPYVTSGPLIGWGIAPVPEGTTLSPTAPVYSGTSPITVAYQWQRKEDGLWLDIAGATALAYTVTHADLALPLRVVATISNANGTVTLASDQAGGATSTPTALTDPTLPAAPGGVTWQVGMTMAATAATFSTPNPGLNVTYQWQRGHGSGYSDIAGATALTYTLTAADENRQLRIVAIATDSLGANRVASNAMVAYPDPLTPVPTPVADPAPVVVAGDMTLTLAVDASAAPSLSGFTLRVEAKNKDDAGPADALVTISLPNGVRFAGQTFNRGTGCAASGQTVVCYFGTLVGRARGIARLALVPPAAGKLTIGATLSDFLGIAKSVSAQVTVSIPADTAALPSASRAAVPDTAGVVITRNGGRIEAAATGAAAFRWEVLRGGRWTTVAGARGATLTPGRSLAGLRVRAVVTLADGRRVVSNVVRLPRR